MEADGGPALLVGLTWGAAWAFEASKFGAEDADRPPPKPAAAAAALGAGCCFATAGCGAGFEIAGVAEAAGFFGAGAGDADAIFVWATAFPGAAVAGTLTGAEVVFAACGFDSLHFSKSSSSARPF